MRLLHINTRKIKYQNVVSEPQPIRDANGDLTGLYTSGYGSAITIRANVSPATGVVNPSYFGADVNYDRVIALSSDLGMDERTQLWIDDLNAAQPDYVVKRVAQSINGCLVAVSKVHNNAVAP